jgi:hypothetical protein
MRLWVVLLVLVFGAAACSNSQNGVAPTPPPTAQQPPTPDALPTVVGTSVTSLAKGYRISFPDGWHARFNLITSEVQRADAYFAPEPEEQAINSSISVVCDMLSENSPEAFVESKLTLVRALAGEEPATTSVPVAGQSAQRVDYIQTSSQAKLAIAKSDVYLVGPKCGYTISYTSSVEQHPVYEKAFTAVLQTFEILDQ